MLDVDICINLIKQNEAACLFISNKSTNIVFQLSKG